MALRLHLDENVDGDILKALRKRGVDVTSAVDAGLRTAVDGAHLAFAYEDNRIIFTHDADFLAVNKMKLDHHGVVYCQQDKLSLGDIIVQLAEICRQYDEGAMRGRVLYLSRRRQ